MNLRGSQIRNMNDVLSSSRGLYLSELYPQQGISYENKWAMRLRMHASLPTSPGFLLLMHYTRSQGFAFIYLPGWTHKRGAVWAQHCAGVQGAGSVCTLSPAWPAFPRLWRGGGIKPTPEAPATQYTVDKGGRAHFSSLGACLEEVPLELILSK